MAAVIAHAVVEVVPDVTRFAQRLTKDLRKITSTFKKVSVGVSPGSIRKVFTEVSRLNLAIRAAIVGFALLATKAAALGAASVLASIGQLSGALLVLPAAGVAAIAAMGALQVGLFGVGDAMKAFLKGDMDKFNEKLKELSPNAQKALGTLKEFQPALKEFRNAVQDALFKDVAPVARILGVELLPRIRLGFTAIATEANHLVQQLAAFVLSKQSLRDIDVTFKNIRDSFHNLVPSGIALAQVIRDVVTVGSGFLPGIAAQLSVSAQSLAKFVAEARASGKLEDFIGRGLDALTKLFNVIFNLGGILRTVFKALDDAGVGVLDTLKNATGALDTFLKTVEGQALLRRFFVEAREAVQALLPVLQAVVGLFVNHLAPIVTSFAQILGPSLVIFITAFGKALDAARPGLEAFAVGVGKFLEAFSTALPTIGKLFGTLAEVMGKILTAIGPPLAKILEEIGQKLIDFFADPAVTQALIDLALAFADLVEASLPLLDPLLKLAKDLLPVFTVFVKALVVLMPSLVKLFDALEPVIVLAAEAAVGLLIPLVGLAIGISKLIELIAHLAVGFGHVVGKIVDGTGKLAGTLGDFATTGKLSFDRFVTKIEGTAVAAEQLFDGMGTHVVELGDVINAQFAEAAADIRRSTGEIGDVLNGFTTTLGPAGLAAGSNYRNALSSELDATINKTIAAADAITFELFGIVEPLGRAGSAAGFKFSDGLRAQLGVAVANARDIASNIAGAFSNTSPFFAAGSSLGDAFASGIIRKEAQVRQAALALMRAASDVFPHSPAKIGPFSGKGWTPNRGLKLAQGFADGILSGFGAVRTASLGLAQTTRRELTQPLGLTATGPRTTFASGSAPQAVQGPISGGDVNVQASVRVFVDGRELRVLASDVVTEHDRALKRSAAAGAGGAR
jgi:hypothetical protein